MLLCFSANCIFRNVAILSIITIHRRTPILSSRMRSVFFQLHFSSTRVLHTYPEKRLFWKQKLCYKTLFLSTMGGQAKAKKKNKPKRKDNRPNKGDFHLMLNIGQLFTVCNIDLPDRSLRQQLLKWIDCVLIFNLPALWHSTNIHFVFKMQDLWDCHPRKEWK